MEGIVKDVVSRTRCYDCGGTMEGRKGEYKYTECGLHSVILKDILLYRCTNCNAVVPEIPAAGVLHRVIALRLARKTNLLTGSEIRFLRKVCGYSVNEFADVLGSSKTVVSKWEKSGAGKETDKVIRVLFLVRMAREASGRPARLLRNVTIDELLGDLDETFKLIEGKGDAAERYEIYPEDIAKLAGVNEETEELVIQ